MEVNDWGQLKQNELPMWEWAKIWYMHTWLYLVLSDGLNGKWNYSGNSRYTGIERIGYVRLYTFSKIAFQKIFES